MSGSNLLTSPVGTIQFMAVNNPIKDSKTGRESYSIKLALDVKADAEWLAKISEINEAKVVTEKSYRGKQEAMKKVLSEGKACVEARSKFQPELFDANGNELDEAPNFFSDSVGTAQMIVQPYIGEKGGTINLVGIIIHSIVGGSEGTTTSTDRETRLAQLREAVEAATK